MSTHRRSESSGAGEWIMGAMTRNPEGLLLLAAGAALLMRTGRGSSGRRSYSEAFPESGRQHSARRESTSSGMGERVGNAARRAGEYVTEATDTVSETAQSYASSAAEYADEASRIAVERSRRMVHRAQETTEYLVREQPWAVALAGLVAGASVAAIFPPTRIERRSLSEVGQRLRSAAGTMGEHLMEAGMQAGERLSEVAEERGLTSEGLKKAAREVGETFNAALAGEQESTTSNQRGERPASGAKTQAQPDAASTQSKGGRPPSGGARS
jgi:hypothetical protein